jgi:hypothetical protein
LYSSRRYKNKDQVKDTRYWEKMRVGETVQAPTMERLCKLHYCPSRVHALSPTGGDTGVIGQQKEEITNVTGQQKKGTTDAIGHQKEGSADAMCPKEGRQMFGSRRGQQML